MTILSYRRLSNYVYRSALDCVWTSLSSSGLSAVYLDCNSTTPLAPDVLEKITEALRIGWANPSSNHEAGSR